MANDTANSAQAALQRAMALDAPINERLKLITAAVRERSPVVAAAIDALVERLERAGAGVSAPGVGDIMPSFALPDETGSLVHLDRLLENGPVVVAFHRGHWCPYCRAGVGALAAAQDRLGAAQLVAIAPELQTYSKTLKADTGAQFPFLTDIDCGYALSLNLAILLDDYVRGLILARGVDIGGFNGVAAWILPIPAVFVVGRDGRIVARHVDPDFRRRMDVDALAAAVDAVDP